MRKIRKKKFDILVVVVVLVAVLVAGFAMSSPLIAYAVRTAKNIPVVVVDAGHGGEDAGVCGKTSGARESDLNLKIALLVGEVLKGLGFSVVYTRTNDTTLKLVDGGTRKRSDMFSRAKIINNAKPQAVVSIHMNFYPSSARRGAQAFFDRKDEEAFRLATCVQDALNVLNLEKTKRTYSPLTAEKYLLTCSPAPTIIVECGFLSNPDDEKNLLDPAYRLALAEKIAQGLNEYLSSCCAEK